MSLFQLRDNKGVAKFWNSNCKIENYTHLKKGCQDENVAKVKYSIDDARTLAMIKFLN